MKTYSDLLDYAIKPTRYMGREINAFKKDPSKVSVRIALAFPDTYEIGMSYLGLKILYEIINSRQHYLAERVYAPWTDMEAMMKKNGVKLLSLESRTPLKDFDIVGFTLPYELCFTNILSMLDLGGIPLLAADRDKRHPLVIGGGSGAFNPEPVADFFDLFVLGDGEEVILEILAIIEKNKDTSKSILLDMLSELEGVYVPSLIDISYNPDGSVSDIRSRHPQPIRKRLLPDLDNAPVPQKPVIPYQAIVHDRITMEIARGCNHGCRFCQAGMIYRPVRERSPGQVVSCLNSAIANTGYDEISLSSLSTGDYSRMDDLIYLLSEFPHLCVSLPSMRPDTLTPLLINFIGSGRKTGFTIAPEAGTQRMRDLINKRITEHDILSTVEKIFQAGWEGIKLYYMIGLPGETGDDIEGIVHLTHKIHRIARRNSRKRFIHIGISTFTPKPHTPFQWHPQGNMQSIQEKLRFLKKNLSHRDFSLKWQKTPVSFLEGVLSLGGREEAKVIHEAFLNGCRFDGWTDIYRYQPWEEAFTRVNLDPARFLHRHKEYSEVLPWDHLQSGVSKKFLWEEYQKSLSGIKTPDCRGGDCSECGICDTFSLNRQIPLKSGNAVAVALPATKVKAPIEGCRSRLRLRYAKAAPMHYLSHLDMNRVFIRALKRAAIPVSLSQGFHPHPKLSFGPALSVGMESEGEYIDLELDHYMDKEELLKKMNENIPVGISITEGRYIDAKASSLISISDRHSYRIVIGSGSNGVWEKIGKPLEETVPRIVADFLKQDQIVIRRGKKGRLLDIKPYLVRLAMINPKDRLELELVIDVPQEGSINPREVLVSIFNLDPQEIPGIRITRTGISRIDPLTIGKDGSLSRPYVNRRSFMS